MLADILQGLLGDAQDAVRWRSSSPSVGARRSVTTVDAGRGPEPVDRIVKGIVEAPAAIAVAAARR